MNPARRSDFRSSSGFTLAELLVTVLIFSVIAVAIGSFYLSTVRTMDTGSTMVYVQRQGTQIQEELARYTQRATALQVDAPGATNSLCQPPSGVPLSPGKSMIYQRTLASSTSPTTPVNEEYWCLYEYRQDTRAGDGGTDAYPQLWRCKVSGLTPPQVCLSSPAPENVVASAQRGYSRQPIAVTGTCFLPAGTIFPPGWLVTDPCPTPNACPCGVLPSGSCKLPCPISLDMSFAVDVMRSPADARSIVGGPRRFGFNITNRN
jgi:prepilin-type N-terminal cleavage/methylation domain-containing protein